MSKLPEKGTKEYALADVLSRPNTMNGTYKKLRLPLEWNNLNKKDATYITYIADLADKTIKEAIDNGKDLDNLKVQEEIQAAVYGSMAGASSATALYKLLHLFHVRK